MIYQLAVLAAFSASVVTGNLLPREEYEKLFFEWMQTHNVKFENGREFVKRLQTFSDNHDIITTTNAKNLSYTLGHNEFSHMTSEEFAQHFNLHPMEAGRLRRTKTGPLTRYTPTQCNSFTANAAIDWNANGAVTPVKNQGNCGSCWSFSATGAMEGAYEIKNGVLQSFSEQQLVSCDTTDAGCNGGWMDDAFQWTMNNGGICTESGYPYTSGTTGTNGACQTTCTEVSGSAPKSYTDVQAGCVLALQDAVTQQPVSVAIQANQPAFQLYKSGVITANCGTRLDHGVLATGYGVWTDNTPYWTVKNSWGTSWGMAGYVLIERSSDDLCGILDAASYPSY